MNTFMKKRIFFVHSQFSANICDLNEKIKGRCKLLSSLVSGFKLLTTDNTVIITPRIANKSDLLAFHDSDYIDFLKTACAATNDDKENDFAATAEKYGLLYDCPEGEGIFLYAALVTGASIVAAQHLLSGQSSVVVNWFGGWHHAKKAEASGFCYFNDVVIAILILRQKFKKVLYVDLDLHHGDGVEQAFSITNSVFCMSIHKFSPGFFPGTGDVDSIGLGRGKYYNVNIPLKDGITDERYCDIFDRTLALVISCFTPDAIVCQCGVDGLSGDPMASFCLTSKTYVHCVSKLTDLQKPLLLLGGGGYNMANAARCWTDVTASLLGVELPREIPEHEYFPCYGPDFSMDITPINRKDENAQEDIERILETVAKNLAHIRQ